MTLPIDFLTALKSLGRSHPGPAKVPRNKNLYPLTYLAVPYSHPNPYVQQYRFRMANRAAAYLMGKGHIVFSPISHSHPISVETGLPGDFKYWEKFDTAFLNYSWKLVVLTLTGWDTSKGIAAEIKIAGKLNLILEYLDPEGIGI